MPPNAENTLTNSAQGMGLTIQILQESPRASRKAIQFPAISREFRQVG